MNRFALALALFGNLAFVPVEALAMEPYLPKNPKAFSKADADSNGKVTAAEIAPLAGKRFIRLDADKNGTVSAAEIDTALTRALERRRDRMLANLDANRDGAISRAELDGFVAKMVEAADGDHDGGITLEEARNYRVAKLRKPVTGETSN